MTRPSLREIGRIPIHPHLFWHVVLVLGVLSDQLEELSPRRGGPQVSNRKVHAAGFKVGMHMLTSFVGKNDPLVHPTPDPGLLKDGQTTLSADVSESATELIATSIWLVL